ncbi:UDP-N-acetylmuramyl pentapeptide phosphotransferase/UDP-N-acetylglucosamine-1-phosphate transferase [Chitinophaga costaii]|uniref:UDP-N-acetylmuramyl pentapeptide phosphotransferase/UDP-N-acetylglucosamine-1-phosphate transferase n=1 Tax=Chitinophaga costaii TaxID=1335309 RepID=A0A1C4DS85_9BACT|nr:MraY family glycosyltransferase [Chitinophaga costaii]PUZ27767.1 undecaprenyl/decaprenyl-phosphate alpha-N-acetylglucosaminyl 1-phosphate transferase [Chitinophaga costaii]SCC34209.1 UDP-N-acetylmuramyl pentapeptide phosphotransferase/UDP-N-acetylglucosamine-1-phosphate transferase [Chitinophaga costaii]
MENVIIATVLSFIVTYLSIPVLIKVAEVKHLFDEPDERKSHKVRIPTLGGIGFFAGFILAAATCAPLADRSPFQYFAAAFFVMFLVGLKDDLVGLSPVKKLIGQMIASFAVIYLGNIQIHSMYGFLGMHELPEHISLLLTYFTFLVTINAFNLIDGVDGLAGGIGLLVSAVLGTYFIEVGEVFYAVLGFAMAGGLAAFLIFNISPARIFMGDTGSLILGLLNTILIVKFIDVAGNPAARLPVNSVPAVAVAILIVPLFDTLRVFAVRMLNGRSPFSADRNHIHHYLLDLGLNHRQTTMVAVFVNVLFIAGAFVFQNLGTGTLLVAMTFLSSLGTGVLYMLRKRRDQPSVVITSLSQVPEMSKIKGTKILHVTTNGVLEDK